MSQKSLSTWIRAAIIGLAIVGIFVYAVLIPSYGASLASEYPEFSNRYLPWMIFLAISALPCYGVLICGWLIAGNIRKDRSFSESNARFLKWIALLVAVDSVYFFIGNIALLFLNMSHPGVVLASLAVIIIGAAITIAAAGLSHLVKKAAVLQEQSDLTI